MAELSYSRCEAHLPLTPGQRHCRPEEKIDHMCVLRRYITHSFRGVSSLGTNTRGALAGRALAKRLLAEQPLI